MHYFRIIIFIVNIILFFEATTQNKTIYYNQRNISVNANDDYEYKKIVFSKKLPLIDSICDYYRNGKIKTKYRNAHFIDFKNDIYSVYKGLIINYDTLGQIEHKFKQDINYDKIVFHRDTVENESFLSAFLFKNNQFNYYLYFGKKNYTFCKLFLFDSIESNVRGQFNSKLKYTKYGGCNLDKQENYIETFDFKNTICNTNQYFATLKYSVLDSLKNYKLGIVYNFIDFYNYSEIMYDNKGNIELNKTVNNVKTTLSSDINKSMSKSPHITFEFNHGFIYFEENDKSSRRIIAIDQELINDNLGYKISSVEKGTISLSLFSLSCGIRPNEMSRFIR